MSNFDVYDAFYLMNRSNKNFTSSFTLTKTFLSNNKNELESIFQFTFISFNKVVINIFRARKTISKYIGHLQFTSFSNNKSKDILKKRNFL